MAANDDKRYYWLKLNKNFFKQHEIIIIEAMPNGKDYLIFYLKLLAESVSHEGNLRFSDKIPYSDVMLSALTNTNVDIVRSALKVFEELHMIEILEDGTVHMNETKNMIGSETGKAQRMREYRASLKEKEQESLGYNEATSGLHCSQEIRDKSIENRYNAKLLNAKSCVGTREENTSINLYPESEEERQNLKQEIVNRHLDIAEFYLLHKLVKPYYFNQVFTLDECITLSDLLKSMDSQYDKMVVAKAWSYSLGRIKTAENKIALLTSILEKNIKIILKNEEDLDEDNSLLAKMKKEGWEVL